jgi:hypothetical protein
MALKNPAAEEWKPGFRFLGTGDDLVSQSQTPVGWYVCLMEGRHHEFSIYRLEHKIEGFVLISDPDLFVVKGQMLHIHAPRAFS